MKHLLLFAAVIQTFTSHDSQQHAVAQSIVKSQSRTIKKNVSYSVHSDYELTNISVKRNIDKVLGMVDSAMRADGVASPLKDSLHFIAAYYVAGFMKGAVWRDTTNYYEWGSAGKKRLVRKKWGDVSGGWKQLINAGITWDMSYFSAHRQYPRRFEENGYHTLYTRWYAKGQKRNTHTIAFFLSP